MRLLVKELPLDSSATNAEVAEEVEEGLFADVNIVRLAAHALVADGGCGGLAVACDLDLLSAVRVAVGQSTHDQDRDGNNVLGVVLGSNERMMAAVMLKATCVQSETSPDSTMLLCSRRMVTAAATQVRRVWT